MAVYGIMTIFAPLYNAKSIPMAKKQTKKNTTDTPKTEDELKIESTRALYNYLYEACNILRGPISQDSFKDYITPLLYYKRISDVYDEETAAALEESGGDEEYASFPEQHRFVIPDECHWNDVRERTEDIGAAIINAMRKIELANPTTLYGVLSVFATANWSNKNVFTDDKLRNLIEHMSTKRLGNNDYANDLMGDAYEMLLKTFADLSKAKAGEFYTPRSVVKLLVQILDPKPGETIYDPACGTAGMLIEAVRYMRNDERCCGAIFGQEKNPTNAAVARMNLFLHGANDFNILCGDTLRDPRILQNDRLAHFDCVIANPPFSLENWGSEAWKTDRFDRNLWGTPTDSCGDYAWIQHMICSMRSISGRMAVVLPQGVLFRGNVEGSIREALVKSDKIEAVVTLGDKLFYGTGLSPCFLIIRDKKSADRQGKILMVDGTKILTQKRAQNVLEENDINRLYALYSQYMDWEDYSCVVTLEEIASKDYNLSPNRYVQYHKEEVKPYSEVLANFRQAYAEMQAAEQAFREILNRDVE